MGNFFSGRYTHELKFLLTHMLWIPTEKLVGKWKTQFSMSTLLFSFRFLLIDIFIYLYLFFYTYIYFIYLYLWRRPHLNRLNRLILLLYLYTCFFLILTFVLSLVFHYKNFFLCNVYWKLKILSSFTSHYKLHKKKLLWNSSIENLNLDSGNKKDKYTYRYLVWK